ncbi:MAG: hypothetical protein ACHRXM_19410 [Isosphaerales bacterium]
MNDRLTVLAVVIGVLALVPLFTGGWALSFATKESIRQNTTRGFFVNVGAKLRGELWGVLATLPLIVFVYIVVCMVVSVRLLLGVKPGVTFRHVKGMLIGVVLTAIFVGSASAFLIVPLMNMSWAPGTLAAKGLGGLDWFLSTWWLPSILSIPLGAIIGLSHTDAQRSDAIDPPQLPMHRQRMPSADETSRPPEKAKKRASKFVGCIAIGFGVPEKAKKRASKFVGCIAIGFGVSATFVWTFIATLNSTGKPGAGVDLHVSVLVGLVATATGACVGWLIDLLRR